MRISDWSSDVCSSDLPPPLCRSRESGGNFATRGLHDRRTAARGVCLSEESWLSGRKRRTRNAKCRQRYRGFESLTLLHFLISTHPRPSAESLGKPRISGVFRVLDRKSTRLNSSH